MVENDGQKNVGRMNSLGAKYEESSLVCGFYHCLQSWLQRVVLLLGLLD